MTAAAGNDFTGTRYNNPFRPADGHVLIHMDNMECSGSERRLQDCSYDADNDCRHFEDAGVRCSVGKNGQKLKCNLN